MSKLGLCCQICSLKPLQTPYLSFCCFKVFCDDCHTSTSHRCRNPHMEKLSSVYCNLISSCERCSDRKATYCCPHCNNQNLCEQCFDCTHKSSKFRLHEKKRLQPDQSFSKKSAIKKLFRESATVLEKLVLGRQESKKSAPDESKDTGVNLQESIEEYRQISRIDTCCEAQAIQSLHIKWNRIESQLKIQFKRLSDIIKDKESEIIREVQRKKSLAIKECHKIYQNTTKNMNIQEIYSNIKTDNRLENFLKAKLAKLLAQSKIMPPAPKQVEYHIGRQYIDEICALVEGLDHRKILIKNVCEDSKVLRDTRISYPVLPTCHTPQLKSHIATPKGTKNLLNFFAGSKKTRENCPKISDFSSILGMQSAKNISKIHQDSLNTTIGSHSYLAAPLKKTKLVKTSSKNS